MQRGQVDDNKHINRTNACHWPVLKREFEFALLTSVRSAHKVFLFE